MYRITRPAETSRSHNVFLMFMSASWSGGLLGTTRIHLKTRSLLFTFASRSFFIFRMFFLVQTAFAVSISLPGSQLRQIRCRPGRLLWYALSNLLKHLPHTCDVLYSFTRTTSQFLFFLKYLTHRFRPGHRMYPFIGEFGLNCVAPRKTTVFLLSVMVFTHLSNVFCVLIYASKRRRAYLKHT